MWEMVIFLLRCSHALYRFITCNGCTQGYVERNGHYDEQVSLVEMARPRAWHDPPLSHSSKTHKHIYVQQADTATTQGSIIVTVILLSSADYIPVVYIHCDLLKQVNLNSFHWRILNTRNVTFLMFAKIQFIYFFVLNTQSADNVACHGSSDVLTCAKL